jgi:multicomponent Na+:H+ antiporter subunit G
MDFALDLLSWALLLSGGFFAIAGGIGVVRLPDFYTRLHASGITDTGAAYLILAGLMIQGGLTIITVKLAMIGFFMFFTNPTSTYALAAAAHRSGIEPLDAAGGPNKPEPVEKSLPNPIELTPSKTGSAPPSQP